MLYSGFQKSKFKHLRRFSDIVADGVDIASLRKKRKERLRKQKEQVGTSTVVRIPSSLQQRPFREPSSVHLVSHMDMVLLPGDRSPIPLPLGAQTSVEYQHPYL
jgi:hypothetical protein